MTLKQRIEDDLKAALLGGDRFRVETLRGLKAAILNEEVAKGLREHGLGDDAIQQVLAREVKKRHESAALYEQNNRKDSAADERREAGILGEYLPKQLTEGELKTIVDAKIAQLNVLDIKMMGQVIGAVKADVGAAADGAMLARLVKEALVSRG